MEHHNDILSLPTTGATKKKLMNISEVAERCGCSRWTIDRMVRLRQIPFIPMLGRRKFDPDVIDEWLKKRMIHEKTYSEG